MVDNRKHPGWDQLRIRKVAKRHVIGSEGQIFRNAEQSIAVGGVVLRPHLVKQNLIVRNTILDLISKPTVCGQEI